MGAEVSSSIGDQIGRFAQCLSSEQEIVDLAHENVIIFDVLACMRYDERKMRQRYVFLLPGLLAISGELKNPRDAFWAAIRDLNLRGTGLDIRLNTNIDSINAKTLRLWNTSISDSDDDNLSNSSFDNDEVDMNNSSAANVTLINEDQDTLHENFFAGIPDRDRKSCMLIRFRDESDARYWERLLHSEKDKVYFPADTFYTDYCVSVHEIHAALMRRFEKLPKNAPLRAFYYSSQMKDGTGVILSYLYHFFFSNVFEDETNGNVDLAEAFVTFMDTVVSNSAVAMVIIAFDFAPDFLDDFYAYRDSALAAISSASLDPVFSLAPRNSNTVDSVNDVTLVQFAHYIRRNVDSNNWSANRLFLADLLEYPHDSPLYAKTTITWFNTIKGGEGKFSSPFAITWTELKLLLAPTPFCAFFFLRHYMLAGDIEFARKLTTSLEYEPTATFTGIKTGSNGISPMKKRGATSSSPWSAPSSASASASSSPGSDSNEWKGSPKVIRSPHDPEQLKVTSKYQYQYEQQTPEKKAAERGRASKSGLLSSAATTATTSTTTPTSPAQGGHTNTPTKTEVRTKIQQLEQEEHVSAHFISFIEWDYIQRVYEAFDKDNTDNRELASLLQVARKAFASPLVSSASLAGKSLDDQQYVEFALQQLSETNYGAEGRDEPGTAAVTEEEKDVAVMKELCLKWMQFNININNGVAAAAAPDGGTTSSTSKSTSTPKASPITSTQSITILTMVNWARSKSLSHQLFESSNRHLDLSSSSSSSWEKNNISSSNTTRSRKVSVVQAGPEEDRSSLCILAAAFFAKRLKRKVQVLYQNDTAMNTDFDRFAPFLSSLDLTPSCNDFEADDWIAFCTKQELCQFYRYNVFRGQSPFSDVVLMSPDVDELHIERDLLTVFAKRDDQMSPPLQLYFDLFLQIGDAAQSPVESCGQFVYSSWARAKLAFSQYKDMAEDEPNGFRFCPETGRYELLDGDGNMVFNKNHLGLDMARYHLSGDAPVVQSTFFYQSVPYIIGTHYLFVGFCKSVSAKPSLEGPIALNRPHLWSMFGAWSFSIPHCEDINLTGINPKVKLAELLQRNSSVLTPKKKVEVAGVESSLLPWNWVNVPGVWTTAPIADSSGSSGSSTNSSKSDVVPVVDMPVGWSAILDRGLMNGYLCECFYRQFPYEGGKWPDKPSHRKLVEYLDSDESRTLEGVSHFATSVRLATSAGEFLYDFKQSAESFR